MRPPKAAPGCLCASRPSAWLDPLEALQQTAWANFADPIGDLAVTTAGFGAIGRRIAALKLPTLIVMEGGYNTAYLGTNTVAMMQAFV